VNYFFRNYTALVCGAHRRRLSGAWEAAKGMVMQCDIDE